MNRVTLGVLLCLGGLTLLHGNNTVIGIIAFVAGIVPMNGWSLSGKKSSLGGTKPPRTPEADQQRR